MAKLANMDPLFRWPGGKRWLVPIIQRLGARVEYDNYFEPFAGGAAAFFGLEPTGAYLSDINRELVTTYRSIRDKPAAVHRALTSMSYSAEHYYAIRDARPGGAVETAARFLYLRQSAFGGIYRTNRAGQFNVPYGGRRRTVALSEIELRRASSALKEANLRCESYETALRDATARSFIYADPPYAVAENPTETFNRYTDRHFAWSDQEALAKLLRELAEQGTYVVASNADLRDVRDLYPSKFFHRVQVTRHSRVARSPEHRREIVEVLFVSRTIYRSAAPLQRMISSWQA